MSMVPLSPFSKNLTNMILFICPAFHSHNTQFRFSTETEIAVLKAEKTPHNGNHNLLNGISKNVRGHLKEAVHNLYFTGCHAIQAHSSAYAHLLKGCVKSKALPEGKLVHAHIIYSACKFHDIFLGNKLMNMYAKCGNLIDARRVFDQISGRNIVSWTVMITAYARHGVSEEALALFYQMQQAGVEPDQFTFASVLPACAGLAALERGKEIHKEIMRRGHQCDVFVSSALVDMYVKCGSLEDALDVFDKMPERDIVSWNAMIAGYAQNGFVDSAWELFEKMPERNVVSWSTMLAGYGQNGRLDEALELFHKMPERNAVSWTAMIGGCAQNGRFDEAVKFFKEMPERDIASWNAMIAGYAQNGFVEEALELFKKMPERNVVSWTAMIAGYAQNGLIDNALDLFQKMPKRNVVSWTTMIAGYVHNGHFDKALEVFQQMQLTDVKPSIDTFANVLAACANLAALVCGKQIHEYTFRSGFHSDVFVGNSLVDMYSKCGSIGDARKAFENILTRNVVSWTAMISGYAMHGHGKEALMLFEQMQLSDTNPNHVTFIGVLSACCHAGMVDVGLQYFDLMRLKYHITPIMEHYCCIVDLLGRGGLLDEAHDFISKMPIKPDTAIWLSLLGACKSHSNIELGERVAELLFELEPKNAATYVLLSNMYAIAGRWNDIERVRKKMKDKSVKKNPGCSWIEVNKQVHFFIVGDN